jgi:hypothetical protein
MYFEERVTGSNNNNKSVYVEILSDYTLFAISLGFCLFSTSMIVGFGKC